MNNMKVSTLKNNLNKNISHLAKFDKKLSSILDIEKSKIKFSSISADDSQSFSFDSEIIFDSLDALSQDINLNCEVSRKIASVRIKSDSSHTFDISSLDNLIIDRHDSESMDFFPCFESKNKISHSKTKDILFLGSLQAFPFENMLRNDIESILRLLNQSNAGNIFSLTIVESNIAHLLLFLSIVDLPGFIDALKSYSIQLNLVFAPTSQEIIIRLFDFYTKSAMTALLGLKVFAFPYLDDELRGVESWLFSQAGLGFCVLGSLGSFTDELNQVAQHLVNTSKSHYLLRQLYDEFKGLNCIVTGSGPSLDNNFQNINKLHQKGAVLIAGGSSIRSLLKNNIVPDFLVLLERGSEVFDTVHELSTEFSSFSEVTLIASSTIDPRISSYFKEIVYFNRPMSSSIIFNYNDQIASLPIAGPESANAALEVAGSLGFNNIVLFGLDFSTPDKLYTRSKEAYDHTPREYNVPQKGSKGRTVYSQDSLISARDSVEKAVQSFPDSKFQRVGEGLVIKNVEEIDLVEKNLDQLFRNDKIDLYSKFKKHFIGLQLNINNDPSILISQLSDQISIIGDCMLNVELLVPFSTLSSDSLHSSTSDFFNSTYYISNKYSFCSRLLRQPVFYMLACVYDADSNDYREKCLCFQTSLQLLLMYSRSFLSRQKQFLESYDHNINWSPSLFATL